MTIHNLPAFIDGLWDWGFLDNCFFPTKIKITDIDGMVERNGKFLMIETKQPGVTIPVGQRIMFDKWIAAGNSCLIIWGKQGIPPYKIMYQTPTGTVEVSDVDDTFIQFIVKWWFSIANDSTLVEARAGKYGE